MVQTDALHSTLALGQEFDIVAQLSKEPDSVWNCLWGHALKISPGINRKSRVLYPGPRFLSSATWPSLPKKHYNGVINQSININLNCVGIIPLGSVMVFVYVAIVPCGYSFCICGVVFVPVGTVMVLFAVVIVLTGVAMVPVGMVSVLVGAGVCVITVPVGAAGCGMLWAAILSV